MAQTSRGRFISFEGGEGSGKSTQLRLLAAKLRKAGLDVVETREPGGTPGAEAIRALLVTGDGDRWDPMTEALLHVAARRDHVTRKIEPALAAGQWVISDRFADSTMAYQGYGQRLGRETVRELGKLALGRFAPDLTIILDVPPDAGLARAHKRHSGTRGGDPIEDRYERMGEAFHKKLRKAFLDIARREPKRCKVIDARGTPEDVSAAVWQVVSKRFAKALREAA
jgi:dTMP kinase